MEIRKITIVKTQGAGMETYETGIETLGELKELLTAKGISHNGMAFYEGISKTELLHDDSQLPRGMSYKGGITNDLVIVLTVANKKIDSGLRA